MNVSNHDRSSNTDVGEQGRLNRHATWIQRDEGGLLLLLLLMVSTYAGRRAGSENQ